MSEPAAPAKTQFQALSLFCDDVRLELGGKVSVMGLYGPTLIASHADRPLPKLSAFVSLVFPSEAVGSTVMVRVTEDDKPLVDTQVPLSAPPPLAQVRQDQAPVNAGLLAMPIEMLGYVPRNGARLQVHLAVGSFTYAGPVLHVLAPDPQPAGEPGQAGTNTSEPEHLP